MTEAGERQNRAMYLAACMGDVSPKHRMEMLEMTGGPEEFIRLSAKDADGFSFLTDSERQQAAEVLARKAQLLSEYERLPQKGICFIGEGDSRYPSKLAALPDRPAGLFVMGRLPENKTPCVAIVGARACSAYGRDCAAWFAEAFSQAGAAVISGMAFGVDGAAGRAAAQARGGSYAVLAGGVDLCYPKENADLYVRLKEGSGGVISEMPPGTPHRSYLFPRRNRIISGLSDAVVVIEARLQSGSLITAACAADQGRLVYAVPGDIRSGLSAGCNELIRNGAILLTKPEELLEDLRMTTEAELVREFKKGRVPVTGAKLDVYEAVGREPVHLEELLSVTSYPSGDLAAALLWLEINGYILQDPKNYYRRTRLIPPET